MDQQKAMEQPHILCNLNIDFVQYSHLCSNGVVLQLYLTNNATARRLNIT
jgi:hypothetical protein